MKKYILLLSAIVSIAITAYFSMLPLNGFNQADISNKFPTSMTPAGFTFSIWSLIYLSWLFLGFHIFKGDMKEKGREIFLFSSAMLLSTIWLIPWHYSWILSSFLIILILLGILLKGFYLKPENIVFKSALELFLGWILAASILNFHVLLVSNNLYTYPVAFTVISILIGTFINFIFLRRHHSFIPPIIYIWALIGIIVKQENNYIQIVSFLSIVFLTLKILYTKVKIHRNKKTNLD